VHHKFDSKTVDHALCLVDIHCVVGMDTVVLNFYLNSFERPFFSARIQQLRDNHARPKRPEEKIVRTRTAAVSNTHRLIGNPGVVFRNDPHLKILHAFDRNSGHSASLQSMYRPVPQ